VTKVQTRRVLITKVASKYGIQPRLIAGMVEVESSGDTWAINPEPKFLKAHNKAMFDYVRHCGNPVALSNYSKSGMPWATSYGLLQILWPVAYERGLRNPWPTVLSKPEVGLTWGCKHLQWLLDQTNDETKAVAAYNGGMGRPNYSYANKVSAAMQNYDW
jgi:soluble lytic murein transglycosylase-like protein